MKFTINRVELQKALKRAKGIVPSRVVLEDCANVLIQAEVDSGIFFNCD